MTDPYRLAAEAWAEICADTPGALPGDVDEIERHLRRPGKVLVVLVATRWVRARALVDSGWVETDAAERAGHLARILGAILATTPPVPSPPDSTGRWTLFG